MRLTTCSTIIKYAFDTSEWQIWESSHRVTKPRGADVDGVDIIAILRKEEKKVSCVKSERERARDERRKR